jgi:biopolymer transport protein ExbD
MNVMFLLIPALLLAMETASMAAIPVEAPRFGPSPGTNQAISETTRVSVMLRAEDVVLSVNDVVEAEFTDLERAEDKGATRDLKALSSAVAEIHGLHPTVASVSISAEQDVEYADVIAVMDTLRGEDCEWNDVRSTPGPGCMFWAPVIRSR